MGRKSSIHVLHITLTQHLIYILCFEQKQADSVGVPSDLNHTNMTIIKTNNARFHTMAMSCTNAANKWAGQGAEPTTV